MRTELERCEGEVRKLELKLEQARDLLSTDTSQRKKAEQVRDMMGQKWDMVREFISQSGDTMNDETRTRLQRLEALSPVGKAPPYSHQGQDLVSRQSTRIRLAPY